MIAYIICAVAGGVAETLFLYYFDGISADRLWSLAGLATCVSLLLCLAPFLFLRMLIWELGLTARWTHSLIWASTGTLALVFMVTSGFSNSGGLADPETQIWLAFTFLAGSFIGLLAHKIEAPERYQTW